jgi:hypothetical protein
MRIIRELDYRNAQAVIDAVNPTLLSRIRDILASPDSRLDPAKGTKARALSSQVQQWFE